MNDVNVTEEIKNRFESEYLHTNILSDEDNTIIILDYQNEYVVPESILIDVQTKMIRLVRELVNDYTVIPSRIVSPYNYSESIIDELKIKPEKSFYTNLIQFYNKDLIV